MPAAVVCPLPHAGSYGVYVEAVNGCIGFPSIASPGDKAAAYAAERIARRIEKLMMCLDIALPCDPSE